MAAMLTNGHSETNACRY